MHPVEVRPAALAEGPTISRLLAEVIRESYTSLLGETTTRRLVNTNCSLTRINAEIAIPGGAPGWLGWLVATDTGGRILGAVAGGVPTHGEGELYVLCTVPDRRREKVGSALLVATTERMLLHGAARQSVSLQAEADPALPFYAAHGFTGTGQRLRRPL
ncbi:GNAT family N-acetyltransferase [Streptomyces sp. NPDC046862]|uniref:GNAT family N-acetyltransferase n=1 Tax=Streptomyces sp. NPDC046862 TaxID=3154603 RepID=UPI0034514231